MRDRTTGHILKIDEAYGVGKDTDGYTVYRLKKVKGKPVWRASWYYPTARSMVKELLDRGLVLPAELSELPAALDDWATKINNTLAGVRKEVSL